MDLEQIKSLIRKCESLEDLNDLKRLIGPSDDESREQKERIKILQSIEKYCEFEKWDSEVSSEVMRYREKHKRLLKECRERFEKIYC